MLSILSVEFAFSEKVKVLMIRLDSSDYLGKLKILTLIGLLAFGSSTHLKSNSFPLQVGINTLAGSVDSLALFATELERTIERLVSFNPELKESSSEQVTVKTAGFLEVDDAERTVDLADASIISLDREPGTATSILDDIFASDEERIAHGLMIRSLPISAPVKGVVTSGFGMRNHPILRGRRAHKGLDIAAPTGTEIFAPGAGVVIFSGRKNGYGNTIIVDHGYGYTTLYGHCSRLLVEEGANVTRGDVIALVGSTGRSTGPHLHYEVRINGDHMNPTAFIYYERDQDNLLAMISAWYLTV